jgi:CelD/BcsL family acetyltransferase involved in cellulose biosynthesis
MLPDRQLNCLDRLKSSPRVQIVTEEQDLIGLAPAWDDLYARAYKPFVTQSFEWVYSVWKNLIRHGRLRFISVWQKDRLALVWPAVIVPYHRFWTAEVPVASPGDYIDFLAETSPETPVLARLAWQNRSRNADLTIVSRVRASSLLHQVITGEAAKPLQTQPARYLDWTQFTDWNAYYRNLSERRSIARRQRRLIDLGNVSFKAVDGINEVRTLSEWMLRHKEIWLSAKGRQSTWVGSKRYEDFLQSIPQELKKFGYIAAFGLFLDARTIAVQICVVGMSRIILLHNAYDQEFREFSPQHILTIRVLEWAYERRLTVDFCVGSEPYKNGFAPENCPVEDYRFPNSWFGKLHECLMSQINPKTANMLLRVVRQIRILRKMSLRKQEA